MKRVLLVGAVAIAALATAVVATSKDKARAHLRSALPVHAKAGAQLRIEWTVDVPDGKGGREPFGASQMFVRLLSASGAAAATAFTDTTADGRNVATATVPQGGLGGIRIGLRGTTDVEFPVVNDPFLVAGGARCDVATFEHTLAAFTTAYNRGDMRRVDRLFAPGDRFGWYSIGAPAARLDPAARNRRTLIAYFRRRHRHGERLVALSFRFGYDPARRLGHFSLTVRRIADDIPGSGATTIEGKGAIDCSHSPATFAVLSLE